MHYRTYCEYMCPSCIAQNIFILCIIHCIVLYNIVHHRVCALQLFDLSHIGALQSRATNLKSSFLMRIILLLPVIDFDSYKLKHRHRLSESTATKWDISAQFLWCSECSLRGFILLILLFFTHSGVTNMLITLLTYWLLKQLVVFLTAPT